MYRTTKCRRTTHRGQGIRFRRKKDIIFGPLLVTLSDDLRHLFIITNGKLKLNSHQISLNILIFQIVRMGGCKQFCCSLRTRVHSTHTKRPRKGFEQMYRLFYKFGSLRERENNCANYLASYFVLIIT